MRWKRSQCASAALARNSMTPERWEEIRKRITDSFEVIDSYQEDLEPGTAEVIEFKGPSGKMKACFNRRPKIVEKKTLYSRRPGSDVKVEYAYSDEDQVCFFTLYQWNENSNAWQKLEARDLSALA